MMTMTPDVTADYAENVARTPRYLSAALNADPSLEVTDDERLTFVGAGSSYNLGRVCEYIAWKCNYPSRTLRPHAFVRHASPGPNETVVCISQSGETDDTVAALERARQTGTDIIGVSATANSTILTEADRTIQFEPEMEYLLARSCGVMSCLGTLLRAFDTLADGSGVAPPEWCSQAVERVEAIADQEIDPPATEGEFVFLATGPLFPIAREAALKVREAALLRASVYDVKNFGHGTAFDYVDGSPVTFVLIEAADDSPRVFDACTDLLADAGHRVVRFESSFDSVRATVDSLMWALKFSVVLNDASEYDLADPPGLKDVHKLLSTTALPPGGVTDDAV
jgi:fructoselysine-6-P-deglycase FrlB-like protein